MSARTRVKLLYRVALTHDVLGVLHTEAVTQREAEEIAVQLERDLPTWSVDVEPVTAVSTS